MLLAACGHSGLPAVDSHEYQEFVTAFYVGLAGLQTGEDVRAKERLTAATNIAPAEPAAWADLALFLVRQGELDPAFTAADKARSLAPENSRIEALVGTIEARRGKLPEAIAHLKKATELDGNNLKAIYSLAEQTERQGTPAADADAEKLLAGIVRKRPDNIATDVEIARLAAKSGDAAGLRNAVGGLKAQSKDWPAEAQTRLLAVETAAAGPNVRAAAVQAAFLRNVLQRVPAYRRTLDDVKTPVTFVGDPLIRFVKLPTPSSRPAAPDTALTFAPGASGGNGVENARWYTLDRDAKLVRGTEAGGVLTLETGAKLPFAGAAKSLAHSVLAADLNYDFKTDFVLANQAGLRVYQQNDPAHFADITAQTKIPAEVLRGNYTGAWAFDVDLDGDLDVVLGTPAAAPVILRNNGDGTFAVAHTFQTVRGLVGFATADPDGDGDPDVALVDGAGHPHVFLNERLGEFKEVELPVFAGGGYLAVAGADLNGDALPDFVLLGKNGAVDRLSLREDSKGWEVEHLAKAGGPALDGATAPFLIGDFDNNGAFDILAGSRLLLNDGHAFAEIRLPEGARVGSVGDNDGDGRLDLLGVAKNGQWTTWTNHGTKNYRWQNIQVRAANGHGDQRINSFGVGGEVEIRANLLTERQSITGPVLHFGLGEQGLTDVARIIWPNGSVQAEFELKPDATILAEQRLKGSCPSLFTWDGTRMRFVKDSAPWSPALGLHINAQAVANVKQTTEWFTLPGDALAVRDGHYDLRVTDELWEAFYIDHYALRAVDHPVGTEVYTDERFSVPPPALEVVTVSAVQPFAAARDDRGADVAAVVRENDGKYLDTFGRGRYQGVTRDHWVELTLPDAAPREGKLYLVASGWLHPTDATVNIALSQNSDPAPQSLSLEVPDRAGKWVVRQHDLGFLAGKLKTAVFALDGVFLPGAERKLRLRTNMEIYWDRLAWGKAVSGGENRESVLPLLRADLHFRGFSAMHQANASSPEIPDYAVHTPGPRWRDMEGYYTRYGDVRELLGSVDDRYVIQNAGDELSLEFGALPPPAAGFARDFIMVGDGWVKDGDYNSGFSQTVLPLPFHAMRDYSQKPGVLEQDPAYRLHPADWDFLQTRYVTPRGFVRALWN